MPKPCFTNLVDALQSYKLIGCNSLSQHRLIGHRTSANKYFLDKCYCLWTCMLWRQISTSRPVSSRKKSKDPLAKHNYRMLKATDRFRRYPSLHASSSPLAIDEQYWDLRRGHYLGRVWQCCLVSLEHRGGRGPAVEEAGARGWRSGASGGGGRRCRQDLGARGDERCPPAEGLEAAAITK
jgi:hypothetical protein